MQLILLAAGKGSRLPRNLRSKPKCLVKIKKDKTIIDYNLAFYKKFKNKIIVTGYKSHLLKSFIKKYNFKEIKNQLYNKTNMVFSAFHCHKLVKDDVVICYADIIFEHKIYSKLKERKNLIPLKLDWLKIWKGRMSLSEIKKDAEDVKIKKKNLFSIGGKIINKLPKYQYMGILKLKFKDYHKLKTFFDKLIIKDISFTNFIDLAIKNKIIKINTIITKQKWLEIDNSSDLKFAKRELW